SAKIAEPTMSTTPTNPIQKLGLRRKYPQARGVERPEVSTVAVRRAAVTPSSLGPVGGRTRSGSPLSRLQLGSDAVERLGDELVGRSLDEPRTHGGESARYVHVGCVVHGGRTVRSVAQGHRGDRVRGAPRRLPVDLDDHAVGRHLLDDLDVAVEPRRDEADADLRDRLVVGFVDHVDRLDARAARGDLGRVGDERPDAVARRLDVDGALELHEASMEWVPGDARKAAGSLMNRVR